MGVKFDTLDMAKKTKWELSLILIGKTRF